MLRRFATFDFADVDLSRRSCPSSSRSLLGLSARARGTARGTVPARARGSANGPTKELRNALRFIAYDLSIDLVTSLRTTLARIKRHDAALAKQGRDRARQRSRSTSTKRMAASAAIGSITSASRSAACARSARCSMSLSRWAISTKRR
jgi:hypothetical protein